MIDKVSALHNPGQNALLKEKICECGAQELQYYSPHSRFNKVFKYRGAYRQAKYLEAEDTKSQDSIVGLFVQTVMYFNHYFIKAISIITVIILSVSTLVTESCLGLYELQELSPGYNTTLQIW